MQINNYIFGLICHFGIFNMFIRSSQAQKSQVQIIKVRSVICEMLVRVQVHLPYPTIFLSSLLIMSHFCYTIICIKLYQIHRFCIRLKENRKSPKIFSKLLFLFLFECIQFFIAFICCAIPNIKEKVTSSGVEKNTTLVWSIVLDVLVIGTVIIGIVLHLT